MWCVLKTVKSSKIFVACLYCLIFVAIPCIGRTGSETTSSLPQDSEEAVEVPKPGDNRNADQPTTETPITPPPQGSSDNNDVGQKEPETSSGPPQTDGQATPTPFHRKIESFYNRKFGQRSPPPQEQSEDGSPPQTGDENLARNPNAGTGEEEKSADGSKNSDGAERSERRVTVGRSGESRSESTLSADQDAETTSDGEQSVRKLQRQDGGKNVMRDDENHREESVGEEAESRNETETDGDKIDDADGPKSKTGVEHSVEDVQNPDGSTTVRVEEIGQSDDGSPTTDLTGISSAETQQTVEQTTVDDGQDGRRVTRTQTRMKRRKNNEKRKQKKKKNFENEPDTTNQQQQDENLEESGVTENGSDVDLQNETATDLTEKQADGSAIEQGENVQNANENITVDGTDREEQTVRSDDGSQLSGPTNSSKISSKETQQTIDETDTDQQQNNDQRTRSSKRRQRRKYKKNLMKNKGNLGGNEPDANPEDGNLEESALDAQMVESGPNETDVPRTEQNEETIETQQSFDETTVEDNAKKDGNANSITKIESSSKKNRLAGKHIEARIFCTFQNDVHKMYTRVKQRFVGDLCQALVFGTPVILSGRRAIMSKRKQAELLNIHKYKGDTLIIVIMKHRSYEDWSVALDNKKREVDLILNFVRRYHVDGIQFSNLQPTAEDQLDTDMQCKIIIFFEMLLEKAKSYGRKLKIGLTIRSYTQSISSGFGSFELLNKLVSWYSVHTISMVKCSPPFLSGTSPLRGKISMEDSILELMGTNIKKSKIIIAIQLYPNKFDTLRPLTYGEMCSANKNTWDKWCAARPEHFYSKGEFLRNLEIWGIQLYNMESDDYLGKCHCYSFPMIRALLRGLADKGKPEVCTYLGTVTNRPSTCSYAHLVSNIQKHEEERT